MNLDKTARKLDNVQRRHPATAFTYAVIKRYGEDHAGYQAALLTYYGFLSLFPLLLVLSTFTQIIASSRPELQTRIINAVGSYFPVLGDQLSGHVHGLHKSGLALAIGLLFIFYGTRGVAAAFRHGVNHVWGIPRNQQDGFPVSALKNFVIIIVGGAGFIAAAAIATAAAAIGTGLLPHLLSSLINIGILFWLFAFLLRYSLPDRIKRSDTRVAALIAAVGIVILQLLGGLILARVLKHLDALYSYFALSLGLLFWIYLQSQMFYYALEIAVVRSQNLWPRSSSGHDPTEADKRLKTLEEHLRV